MMDSTQLRLMTRLAKELKGKKRDKAQILRSFVAAGILTPNGSYTRNYAELKRAEESSATA